jgi:hypothetical protein
LHLNDRANDPIQCLNLANKDLTSLNTLLHSYHLPVLDKGSYEYKDPHFNSGLENLKVAVINRYTPCVPTAYIIPELRRISDAASYEINGTGVIKLLAGWQNPDDSQYELRTKFERIQSLLCSLLERKVAIDVPRGETKIVVHEGDKHLPLESHGTGIHQLIILAIAVSYKEGVILGIEEPEIHLHPVLQRRFIKFLKEETSNRYVITTHSPTLIVPDAEVAVIHLKMVDGVTVPTPVSTDAQTLEALDDLGLRASDLLQANSVIWVEGPSDRIYLRRWLELLAPDLSEGIDYAVMIYGGRLLSHLTLEEKSAEEDVARFINLLRINQRSVVVMDSDRKSSVSEPINATKQRIVQEAQKSGAHAWVTDGREIENELSPRAIEAALNAEGLLDGTIKLGPLDKIENSIKAAMRQHSKPPGWAAYEENKPEWAHRFCKVMQKEDLSESLVKHLDGLITFIRRRR